jgi:Protein of unknown function (DUF2846)
MKEIVIAVLFLAGQLLAQNTAPDQAAQARMAAGCGPNEIHFDVKTDKHQHPAGQPEAGKALVYIFNDTDKDNLPHIGGLTTRVGLDGAWVGANDGKSYFFFQVNPGDHRLCTSWQSVLKSRTQVSSATSLTADAGKIFYFRTKTPDHPGPGRTQQIELVSVDPAAAQILIAASAFSTSHPKQ